MDNFDEKELEIIKNKYNKLNEIKLNIDNISNEIKLKNIEYGGLLKQLEDIIDNYNRELHKEFNNNDIDSCTININNMCENIKSQFFLNKNIKDNILKNINSLDTKLVLLRNEEKEIKNNLENLNELNDLINDEITKHLELMKTYGGYKHDIMCYICRENKCFIPCRLKTDCDCRYIICYNCAKIVTNTNNIEAENSIDRKYRRNNYIKCLICMKELKTTIPTVLTTIEIDRTLMKRLTISLNNFKEKFKKKYGIEVPLFKCSKCNCKVNSLEQLEKHIEEDCLEEIIICPKCFCFHKRRATCNGDDMV